MTNIDECLMRMAPQIEQMDLGQRQVLATMLEVHRCIERSGDGLLCPDDVGLIKATNGTGTVSFAVGGLAPGATATAVLPALGLLYCLTFGLEQANMAADDIYEFTVQRSGSTVLTLGRPNFMGTTANPRAAACYPVCVGKLQPVTLNIRNTGPLAYAATATLSIQLYRDFSGQCTTGYGAMQVGCASKGC